MSLSNSVQLPANLQDKAGHNQIFQPRCGDEGQQRSATRWRDSLLRTQCLVQFHHPSFITTILSSTVKEALLESQFDPALLELEMTETLSLDETELTLHIMDRLKHLGVSLSLDDFGTGWSSLTYLRRFPLDRLKIDRAFMRGIGTEPAAKALVSGIIGLARALGMASIAEGVETMEQLRFLEANGCAEFQDFLYSPAVSASECGALMRAANQRTVSRATAANEETSTSC